MPATPVIDEEAKDELISDILSLGTPETILDDNAWSVWREIQDNATRDYLDNYLSSFEGDELVTLLRTLKAKREGVIEDGKRKESEGSEGCKA